MKASEFVKRVDDATDRFLVPLGWALIVAMAALLVLVPPVSGGEPPRNYGLAALPDPIPPDGVRRDEMANDGRPRYLLNGDPVDERTAFHAMADSDLFADDSKLPWVTLVGPKAERDRIRADFKLPPLAGIPCRLKGYDPGAGPVKDFPPGLIHLQAPNGRPLFAADAYNGAAWLAAGLRDALAGYDASKDPGPGKPYPKPAPPPVPAVPAAPPRRAVTLPAWAVYASVVVFVFLIFRGKK